MDLHWILISNVAVFCANKEQVIASTQNYHFVPWWYINIFCCWKVHEYIMSAWLKLATSFILVDDFSFILFSVGSITRMDHGIDRDGVHVSLCLSVVALMLIPLYIDGPRKFGSSVTNCE